MDSGASEEEPINEASSKTEIKGGNAWMLYCSRALTAWGDRLWAFGLGLLLFRIYPENLQLLAAYGFANCTTSILFGASIGNWIDASERFKAAKTFLIIQNLSVALDCALLAAYFNWKVEAIEYFGSWVTFLVALISIAIALVANLSSTGSKIVVEKDWIVVIAGGDDDKLAKMNSIFRTIDLVCLTAAPSIAGVLFTYASYVFTAIAIGVWNICSVILEYILLVYIHKQFSGLSKKSVPREESSTGFFSKISGSYNGWIYYFKHEVRNAGLGLAFLYMTVLGFDAITWAFAITQCVPEYVLGILVAVSAFIGILGSLTFPTLRKCFGLKKSGLVGMGALVTCLCLCVISVWLPGSPFDPWFEQSNVSEVVEEGSGMTEEVATDTIEQVCDSSAPNATSVAVLLAGIILARFGLWVTDLSVTQILQENVTELKRGVVGGVQNSLNSGMDLLKYVFVLLLPNPNSFGFLIVLSFAFICMGAVSFSTFACKGSCLCCPKSKYAAARTSESV